MNKSLPHITESVPQLNGEGHQDVLSENRMDAVVIWILYLELIYIALFALSTIVSYLRVATKPDAKC